VISEGLLSIILVICPTVEVINKAEPSKELTLRDLKAFGGARETCKTKKGNECLTYFMKSEEGVYSVLCGPKIEKPGLFRF